MSGYIKSPKQQDQIDFTVVYLCYCFLQTVYVQYDADRSGVIDSNEVPAAFKAAGDKHSSVCAFVSEKGV